MKKFSKLLAVLMAACMLVMAFAGCKTATDSNKGTETEPTAAPEANTPLVVAYMPFSQKFSPFYADTGYDMDAEAMTQIAILTTDRVGGIVFNAIEGETRSYNGTDYLYTGAADTKVEYDAASDTTTYTAKLREDLVFSDGVPVTADDIIFSLYTLLDPSYAGSSTLSSYDIVGLQNYRTQTSDDVYAKYAQLTKDIFAAGADHVWSESDGWTEAQQTGYWELIKTNWMADVQGIVSYVLNNYMDYAPTNFGHTAEEVNASEGMQIAFGMIMWGFGGFADDGVTFTGAYSGNTWDLTTTFPTIEDYYNETYLAYEGSVDAYAATESANGTDVHAVADGQFISTYGPQDESMAGAGVASIAGIKKVDDYTVTITVNGYSAPAVYSILGIEVAPMHYYGSTEKYDYENGKYGFDFGDLSSQQAVTTQPLGAGAYKFVKYENKVIYYEANENYYKGEPKIKEVQFKETVATEVASAVQTGTADAGEMTGSRTRFEEVASYNSNGDITGDVITTSKVDNLGYGYLGINADTVNVGGVPDSDASKALRKALMTVLAVYRDTAIDSYYGEAASVIQYPISNTSWAAPQPTDEGYRNAFSMDATGADIYTSGMSADEKYAAATAAALTFFEAAGYTVADGKVTAAPDGAKLSYECMIPGDGTGDHPAFAILTDAQAAFAAIGIEFKINDLSDANILWDSLDAGTQEMWTAAWGATIDPDMYQVYHSSGVVGEGGSDSNHYHIRSAELDQLIVDARASDDQSYRKSVYKQCLDIIADWAVELPTYQRQNCIIFSTQRINIDTLTPDITTFWGWMHDIELLEMN